MLIFNVSKIHVLELYSLFAGYANELGEAFRSFVHVNLVRASYAVASCYVAADAADKGRLAKKRVRDSKCRSTMKIPIKLL